MEGLKSKFVLFEGALNNDELEVADVENGYTFKRNGRPYKFHVVYWTYADERSNHKHEFCSNSLESALDRYNAETDRERLTEDTRESIMCCEI